MDQDGIAYVKEVKRLQEQLSAKDAEIKALCEASAENFDIHKMISNELFDVRTQLSDSVPRSRIIVMEAEIQAEKDKLERVRESCGKEIRDLWDKLSAKDRELASARAEAEGVRKLMLVQTEYYLKAESNYDQEIARLKSELEKCKPKD
jgi:chromosome segregation ATPase